MAGLRLWFGVALLNLAAAGAMAQTPPSTTEAEAALAPAAETAAPEVAAEPNPDEMADSLNAQQQIKQSFTFTRTIDGKVVETDTKTVTYSRDDPMRPTEAGETALESLRQAFDREVLTRTEAFEEAKLDFVIADRDRDNTINADEFAALVETWRETGAHETTAPAANEETARQRQYRAFIEEIDPEGAKQEAAERAKRKFMYMAGAAQYLSREDYLREYLLDFDSMDADGDSILKGEELMMFRAVNRGETLSTQAE